MRAVCSKGLLTRTHPGFFGWLRPRVCALVIASGLHGLAVPTANAQASSDLLSGQRLIFENDDVWIVGSNQQPPGAGISVTVARPPALMLPGSSAPGVADRPISSKRREIQQPQEDGCSISPRIR